MRNAIRAVLAAAIVPAMLAIAPASTAEAKNPCTQTLATKTIKLGSQTLGKATFARSAPIKSSKDGKYYRFICHSYMNTGGQKQSNLRLSVVANGRTQSITQNPVSYRVTYTNRPTSLSNASIFYKGQVTVKDGSKSRTISWTHR